MKPNEWALVTLCASAGPRAKSIDSIGRMTKSIAFGLVEFSVIRVIQCEMYVVPLPLVHRSTSDPDHRLLELAVVGVLNTLG
jgi:hypothetical protein